MFDWIFCLATFGMNIVIRILYSKIISMKSTFYIALLLLVSSFDQIENSGNASYKAYDVGEWFEFRMHYENFIDAGKAELSVKEATFNGKKVYHTKGYGYTTGLTKFFFKVEDDYQSFIDKETGRPYKYIRKINEGGYTKDQEGIFDQNKQTVLVKDFKNKTETTYSVTENAQDILSAFYYLRNHPDIETLNTNDYLEIDMFFDGEIFKFKLKYLGKEDLKTKFGVVPSLKFRPYVQSGRVFKEKESVTVWISADKNKLPIKFKADLAVGSLNADLERFRGLRNPLMIKAKK